MDPHNINNNEDLERLTREYGGEWGIHHSHRLLKLIEIIGEGLDYDHEVVRTAAYLHDWGAYSPWMQPGVDHALRSGEVARQVLAPRGFPETFTRLVITCVETHHLGDPDRPLEARLLSDADALDFLGIVGVLRDFSKNPKAMRTAYNTIQKRMARLPGQLSLELSRQIAAQRIAEMQEVLARFEEESFGCY